MAKSENPEQTIQKEKKKIDILGLTFLLLLVFNLITVGALGYYLKVLWQNFYDLKSETRKIAAKSEEENLTANKKISEPELGILFPLESFLVNITSAHGPKFLQTQIELEISDGRVENEIVSKKPAIRDAIIVLLSSHTYEQLKDPAGMNKLRADILRSVNNLLTSGTVKSLYFTQFHFN